MSKFSKRVDEVKVSIVGGGGFIVDSSDEMQQASPQDIRDIRTFLFKRTVAK